jgi:two-component sensor histidine kinase
VGRQGALWVGTYKGGVNRFFPREIHDNPHAAPIALTAFKVFTERAALDTALGEVKTIQLSYRQNFFSFDFAALDFAQPEKNQYAYKMEGFDQDWIYSETRRYANGAFNMIISDDGDAIPAEENITGQGLRNMKMRAERIGGRLEISRDPGYTVKLTAPALRQFFISPQATALM